MGRVTGIIDLSEKIYYRRYGVRIKLHRGTYIGPLSQLLYYQKGMTFKQFERRKPYLRWLTAIWQIKYGMAYVEADYFQYDHVPLRKERLKRAKDLWIGAKRNLSKHKNKLRRARDNWNYLFPIEDDPLYPKAVAKIKRLERTLEERHQAYHKLLPSP